MTDRTTPDSAVVGERVRTNVGEGVVVASRPAGRNFLDVKLDDGQTAYGVCNYEVLESAEPVVDSELRSRIAEVAREASGTTEGSQYYAPIHWDDVAEEIHAKVVAPALAARDRLLAQSDQQWEQAEAGLKRALAELQRERESRQDWAAEAMRLDAELARARHERSGVEVGQPDTEATEQAQSILDGTQ